MWFFPLSILDSTSPKSLDFQVSREFSSDKLGILFFWVFLEPWVVKDFLLIINILLVTLDHQSKDVFEGCPLLLLECCFVFIGETMKN